MLKLVAADQTCITRVTAYDQQADQQLQLDASIMVIAYVYRDNTLLLTKNTKIFRCDNVVTTPELEEQGIQLLSAPTTAVKPIAELATSPVKSIVSIRGKITKDQLPRKVTIAAQPTLVREITVEDSTGQLPVSLWRETSAIPMNIGANIQISGVSLRYSDYHKKNTIYAYEIDILPDTEEVHDYTLLALATNIVDNLPNTLQLLATTDDDTIEVSCAKDALFQFLHLPLAGQVSVEDVLSLLPVSCQGVLLDGQLTNIEPTDTAHL